MTENEIPEPVEECELRFSFGKLKAEAKGAKAADILGTLLAKYQWVVLTSLLVGSGLIGYFADVLLNAILPVVHH